MLAEWNEEQEGIASIRECTLSL